MTRARIQPCANCGHEKSDHQGLSNRGHCTEDCHCRRFKAVRHWSPTGQPLRGYYPGVECEHGYDCCPMCDAVPAATEAQP